jgi:lipopolysaccharide export system permease protein
MSLQDAYQWITTLRRAGLDYRSALTDYYKRFTFALTPFLVALLSSAIGGKLKKNILLMSLLISLVISVLYYVFQMVFVLIAKLGYIPPILGAWLPFILFFIPSVMLFRYART